MIEMAVILKVILMVALIFEYDNYCRHEVSRKELSMLDTDGCRYCDRCGVKLTPENNKNGYELCDRCDKQLHEELKADREKREKERMKC